MELTIFLSRVLTIGKFAVDHYEKFVLNSPECSRYFGEGVQNFKFNWRKDIIRKFEKLLGTLFGTSLVGGPKIILRLRKHTENQFLPTGLLLLYFESRINSPQMFYATYV